MFLHNSTFGTHTLAEPLVNLNKDDKEDKLLDLRLLLLVHTVIPKRDLLSVLILCPFVET